MDNQPPHPYAYLPAELTGALRNAAPAAEVQGSLTAGQLYMIYAQNWFNLFVPKSLGGLELSLPEGLAVEEALAWADGSTGWTVTLCSGANWFAGFLNPEISAAIFGDKKVCLAGSGQPAGLAKIKGDGYEITGRWQYATGAPHATAFTANCVIEKEGVVLCDDDGSPLVKPFIFMRGEVTIFNDWHTMGMVATASHSFAVNNLYVAANRCFAIDAAHAVIKQPLYTYPFLQFAEATLTVNIAGMAARFVELAETTFAPRTKQTSTQGGSLPAAACQKLAAAKEQMNAARRQFYAAVHASWQACAGNGAINTLLVYKVSHACRMLTAVCLQAAGTLYPFCGLAAANPGMEINRVWRNLHTASQHTLLTPV